MAETSTVRAFLKSRVTQRGSAAEIISDVNRLDAIIRQQAQTPADAILRSVIHAVQKFRASAKQEDDITLAMIKVVD